MKLDKSRPFATLFDGERQIQCHYQDGKMFDMGTDEELNLDSIPKKAKEPPPLICKFCRTKRQTAELMHEHLIARHSEEMAEAKAKKEAEEKAEAEAKAKDTAERNQDGTPYDKGSSGEGAEDAKPESETNAEDKPNLRQKPRAAGLNLKPKKPKQRPGPRKKIARNE